MKNYLNNPRMLTVISVIEWIMFLARNLKIVSLIPGQITVLCS